jgi:hypothetical protein
LLAGIGYLVMEAGTSLARRSSDNMALVEVVSTANLSMHYRMGEK